LESTRWGLGEKKKENRPRGGFQGGQKLYIFNFGRKKMRNIGPGKKRMGGKALMRDKARGRAPRPMDEQHGWPTARRKTGCDQPSGENAQTSKGVKKATAKKAAAVSGELPVGHEKMGRGGG